MTRHFAGSNFLFFKKDIDKFKKLVGVHNTSVTLNVFFRIIGKKLKAFGALTFAERKNVRLSVQIVVKLFVPESDFSRIFLCTAEIDFFNVRP